MTARSAFAKLFVSSACGSLSRKPHTYWRFHTELPVDRRTVLKSKSAPRALIARLIFCQFRRRQLFDVFNLRCPWDVFFCLSMKLKDFPSSIIPAGHTFGTVNALAAPSEVFSSDRPSIDPACTEHIWHMLSSFHPCKFDPQKLCGGALVLYLYSSCSQFLNLPRKAMLPATVVLILRWSISS